MSDVLKIGLDAEHLTPGFFQSGGAMAMKPVKARCIMYLPPRPAIAKVNERRLPATDMNLSRAMTICFLL